MRGLPRRPIPLLALLLAGGCGGDPQGGEAYRVERALAGDTTVVRSLAGSVWGGDGRLVPEVSIGVLDGDERYMLGRVRGLTRDPDGQILVVDADVPGIRVFGPDGDWLATWGREGAGPGEFRRPDGGIVALADGRIVVRDPGNARLQVLSATGEPIGQWGLVSNQFINRTPFSLQGDTILNPDVVNISAPLTEWRRGMVRITGAGAVLDTLAVPDDGVRVPMLRARNGGNMSEAALPWAAEQFWAWHPDGFFVHGRGDQYRLTLDRPGSPLRIERTVAPVEVTPAERAQETERVTKGMQWLDPSWRWTGPEIPATKPMFAGLFTGRQGRVWVLRLGRAVPVEDPDYDPGDPFDVEIRLGEERIFDVFNPSGEFLGSIPLPADMLLRPTPEFDGDLVLAATRDTLGVERVVRYRVGVPTTGR